jgi:amidophosphoribosyltransferase
MCGIVGIVATQPVNASLYDALTVLQHRGQDAAGIATLHDDRLFLRRAVGMVRDIFRDEHMGRLKGHIGIGHNRYPTAGRTSSAAEAQPFYVNAPFGIALGHNGNLTNTEALAHELRTQERRHLNTTSDSEVLLNVLAHELSRAEGVVPREEDIIRAIEALMRRCRGAYAVVALVVGYGMIAFRDPYGIRPLVYGERHVGEHREIMVASESVALDVVGFQRVQDVAPGEALLVRPDGSTRTVRCAETARYVPCIFEHVYLSRPDSILDGTNVYRTRLRMGQKLAQRILRERPDHDIDAIIPIPDTSRTAAIEMASMLGVPFREGFIKNRYIGRTFIMPGQHKRQKSVRQKLNPIPLEFEGRNVLLVDDSIVRGTTCRQIVEMAREAGAHKVYFASAAPPVRYPNVYGIDMPAADELIAHGRTPEEVCEAIGADWLLYQHLDDLLDACREENPAIQEYECSIFNGAYITGDVSADYLLQLATARNDGARSLEEQLDLSFDSNEGM